ncbi:hypothetical protein [Bradyrhizobium prioriisuperbiae]|uniref:hypothetical protein n=1 Tax=Bradyrhizobium prioriisuperbiae TaxID=2854389 RepID=UPI0028EE6F40|nr:hypothetical protein [Bradyrhizobium prioritasuperba]
MSSAKPGAVPVSGMIADQPTLMRRLFGTADARNDWHTRALRAWLLALLRLAVTGDRADRLEVMATARALDGLGATTTDERTLTDQTLNDPVFHFFHATSAKLCRAIADPTQPDCDDVLRRHIARIDDRRLKRAFAAAVDIEPSVPRPAVASFGPSARNARHR